MLAAAGGGHGGTPVEASSKDQPLGIQLVQQRCCVACIRKKCKLRDWSVFECQPMPAYWIRYRTWMLRSDSSPCKGSFQFQFQAMMIICKLLWVALSAQTVARGK